MSDSGKEARPPIQTRTPRHRRPHEKEAPPGRLPPYHVVLLNDNDHTYDYVIEMLSSVFGYAPTKGYLMAHQLNPLGRVIVMTTHKEHAELKRDQIHAFGRDFRLPRSVGSMSAMIEPAE